VKAHGGSTRPVALLLQYWIQAMTAKRKMSVSRLVKTELRDHMQSEDAYEEARRQFFSVEPQPLRSSGSPLPSREEIHDRSGLR
jgi:hypothetical protein